MKEGLSLSRLFRVFRDACEGVVVTFDRFEFYSRPRGRVMARNSVLAWPLSADHA